MASSIGIGGGTPAGQAAGGWDLSAGADERLRAGDDVAPVKAARSAGVKFQKARAERIDLSWSVGIPVRIESSSTWSRSASWRQKAASSCRSAPPSLPSRVGVACEGASETERGKHGVAKTLASWLWLDRGVAVVRVAWSWCIAWKYSSCTASWRWNAEHCDSKS